MPSAIAATRTAPIAAMRPIKVEGRTPSLTLSPAGAVCPGIASDASKGARRVSIGNRALARADATACGLGYNTLAGGRRGLRGDRHLPAEGRMPMQCLCRMAGDHVSLGDAARAIGVSVDTLRRWDRAGKLRTVR